MSPPLSLASVLATLRRLSPLWPSSDPNTSVGKELGSIAVAAGMAKDAVDAFIDEFFPDTTTALIGRWEQALKIASVTSDPIATRRARVIARLRKVNGPRISQLETMLAPVLALDPTDMVWVEQLRSHIEEALTQTTGVVSLSVPGLSPGLRLEMGAPWPGVVDDTGVMVFVALSGVGFTTATLTSPSGTVWSVPITGTGWYFTRSLFVGEPAGGRWTFKIFDTSSPTLTEMRLLVSNNIDSGQIANFYVLRDPTLAGTADLVEAQRLLHATALANMRAFVVEALAFTIGDQHSLIGRDPLGV